MSKPDHHMLVRVAVALDLLSEERAVTLLDDAEAVPGFEASLTGGDRARLREVIDRLLADHNGDPEQALASLELPETLHPDAHLAATLPGMPGRGRDYTAPVTSAEEDPAQRYRDPVEFSRGGMGRVLIVRDTRMNRSVAMKELLPAVDPQGKTRLQPDSDPPASAHWVRRFLREARITGSLEHPSIVPVYELGQRADGSHYYTMKLVRGRTLYEAIREARTLDDRLKLLPHVIDLCQAIAYAHDKGIIHRDIKPSNVMVGSFGETVVIDWGLAKVLGQEDPYAADIDAPFSESPMATLAGIPVGTPHYMSPEQAEGRIDLVGPHSDVYSLGVVLYEVLAGRTPFVGTDSNVVLLKVRTDQPPNVLTHSPNLPPDLAAICARAMERDPERRYASALEMAEDLTRFTTGALVRGHTYTFGELVRHYYRRHRALCNTVLAASGVTLMVAVTAYAQILQANHRERQQRAAAEKNAYRTGIQLAANQLEDGHVNEARSLLLAQPVEQRQLEWGLLLAQCLEDAGTATDHRGQVTGLWALPGNRLLSHGFQDALTVRDMDTLAPIHRFSVDGLPGVSVAQSKNGELLAITLMDGRLLLANTRTGNIIRETVQPGAALTGVAFNPDESLLAAGSEHQGIMIWRTDTLDLARRIDTREVEVLVTGFTGDGTGVIAAGQGRITIWGVNDGALRLEFAGGYPSFDDQRARLATVADNQLLVYDVATGSTLLSEEIVPTSGQGGDRPILSPDGSLVAHFQSGLGLRIWQVDTGTIVRVLNDPGVGLPLNFSPDSSRLAVELSPHRAQVYDLSRPNQAPWILRGHSLPVKGAKFSDDGTTVFTTAFDQEIKRWTLGDGPDLPLTRASVDNRVSRLAVSSRAGRAIAGGSTLSILDLDTLDPLLSIAGIAAMIPAAPRISADGTLATLQIASRSFVPMTMADLRMSGVRTDPDGPILAMALSPDGATIATGGNGGIRLWSANDTSPVSRIAVPGGTVISLAFGDNEKLVAGDLAGRIVVWDWRGQKALATLRDEGSAVIGLAINRAGTHLAAVFREEPPLLYALGTTNAPRPLLARAERDLQLEFSEDDQRLVGLSRGQIVNLWDGDSGELVTSLPVAELASAAVFDTSHNRLLLGFAHRVLTATPIAPAGLANDSTATSEPIERFKREARASKRVFVVSPRDSLAFVTPPILDEAAARLETLPPREPEGYIEPGSNPLIRLGIAPGDRLLSVQDNPMVTAAQLALAVRSLAGEGGGEALDVPVQVDRNGTPFALTWRVVRAETRQRSMTLGRIEALTMLRGTRDILTRFATNQREQSQRLGRTTGADLSGDQLSGYWVPSPGTKEESSALATLGLAANDRILRVMDKAVERYSDLDRWIEAAIAALESGWSGSVSLLLEHDRFLYTELVWSVE